MAVVQGQQSGGPISKADPDTTQTRLFEGYVKSIEHQLPTTEAAKSGFDAQKGFPKRSSMAFDRLRARLLDYDPQKRLQSSSWESVLDLLDSKKLEAQAHKPALVSRNASASVGILQSLNAMIPDEKGMSVLKGGLEFVFKEFNARVDNYEKIQTALADTPKVFCNVYETLQCLPDDEVLYNLVNDLYDTVADSLVELLDLHMGTQKPSHSARQNYLLKLPSQKAKTIRDALDRIIIAKKDVQDRCEICAKKLQQEEYRLVKSSHEEGHAIRRTVVDTKVQVEDVQNRIQEQGVELQKQISLMTDGVRQDISNYHQSVQNFANDDASRLRPVVHNYFVVNYGGPMMGSIPTGVPQIPQTLSPRSMIAISRLILLLNVDRSIISNDLHETSRHGNTMPTDALSEARYLLSTPEFKHWFSNPSSSLLLVEGAHQQANKSTPLSVLCASLVTELPRLGPFQPLYFFCDQHNSDSDPLSGPKGLLRSLITQLLYQIPPAASNLTFLTRHVLHHVSKHNLNALFYTFATLVANLPASVTLVVILDSLNKYSSLPDWEADTLRLASHFRELVDVMPRHGSRLKMLITSKGKALDLGERIAREENERVKIGAGAGAGKFARSHGLGDELMRNEASGDWEWDSSVGQRGTGNGSAGTDTASWEF